MAAALALVPNAGAIQFTLDSSSANIISGNLNLPFYNATPGTPVTETGTGAGIFEATFGGSATIGQGWWVDFTWGSNPQPEISSAYIKAGNFHLLWDAADFAAFNAGVFDSIRLIQDGIANRPNNAYLGTSHAGFAGEPGTPPGERVPDGGATVALLGAGILGVFALRRKLDA
jgi:hypothetical protein